MTTATRIRTLREQQGLSQEAFAKVIGRSRSLVAAWEAGRKEPGRDALRVIGKAFNLPVDYLLGENNEIGVLASGPQEVTLVEMFRNADEQTRISVLHMLNLSRGLKNSS
ncbi:helix-turn-helix domain-containing protein [Komagataeibacter sp. SM21]|uniref:helix-turn-helix domain-containing protein n=1 Tax=Komagataeibacter sp. SM21 TaxID=3242899 RepID=UPI0035292324